ncbi:MAG: ABC transporter ATP-binding protein [Chthoniobacteraceae bacterium]|nr:ABC transporter ATP-binding protein [Chthoniobacteraceae bacterium]
MNHAIETHQLSRRFRRCEAVHDLDLRVPLGTVYALLGRNGAGKSTTIKMVAGLLRPTSGSSRTLGTDSQNLRPADWQNIGYVSENQKLYEWLTGAELAAFVARLYPRWDHGFASALVRQLDLPMSRKVEGYSRGQKIKLSLLLALAFRPRLLILDEPFSGLDPLVREELLTSLLEITTQNEWSVFFATNDIEEVERLADYTGILEEGRLRVSEPLETLQARFRSVEAHGQPGQLDALVQSGAICVQRESGSARFVYTAYSSDTESEWSTQTGGADIEAAPMSLKEIFVSLAKSHRDSHPSA